uniref:Secreted protein n=1 Tax=Anopheles merus TaxID=30066 RepID=A0A182VCH8_ANOME
MVEQLLLRVRLKQHRRMVVVNRLLLLLLLLVAYHGVGNGRTSATACTGLFGDERQRVVMVQMMMLDGVRRAGVVGKVHRVQGGRRHLDVLDLQRGHRKRHRVGGGVGRIASIARCGHPTTLERWRRKLQVVGDDLRNRPAADGGTSDRLRTVEVDVRIRYHLVGGEGRWGRRCRHRLLPEKGTVRAGADAATHPQLVLLGRIRPQADAHVVVVMVQRPAMRPTSGRRRAGNRGREGIAAQPGANHAEAHHAGGRPAHHLAADDVLHALDREQNLLLVAQLHDADVLQVFPCQLRHVVDGLVALRQQRLHVLLEPQQPQPLVDRAGHVAG